MQAPKDRPSGAHHSPLLCSRVMFVCLSLASSTARSEFNYPPCLTVVHFDPAGDAIPVRAKQVMKRCTWVWYASVLILGINILTNVAMVGAKAEPGVVILYAFLRARRHRDAAGAVSQRRGCVVRSAHVGSVFAWPRLCVLFGWRCFAVSAVCAVIPEFLIGMVGGFVSLYQGYRGVAGDLVRSSRRYLVAQSLLTLLMLLFAILTSGNVHGFVGITSHVADRPQPAFLLICIFEGTMWMVCAVASIWVMHGVYKVGGHAHNRELRAVNR